MEEVDDIIIHSLRLIGCEIGDEVDSIKLFSTDLIVNATVSCLKLISPDNHGTNQLSAKLPSSMSGRFRLGSVLTDACKEIGYKGEIGYQTFLYANEVDIRRVFMFLIEKLPKDVEKSIDEPLGASTLLNRAISSELAKRLKLPWLPPVCSPSGVRNVANDEWHREGFKTCADFNCHQLVIPYGLEDLTQMPSKELISYFSNHVHPITRQLASPDALSSSVLERNAISSTADQEWENEWNLTGLSSRLSASDYRARKKQRIDKRIRDSLKRQLQSCEVGGNGTNAQHDLHQLLTSMSTNTTPVGNKFDDSRFAHSEKLQFTEDKNVDDQLPVLQNIGSSVADVEEEMKKKRKEELECVNNNLERVISQIDQLDLEVKKYSANVQQMAQQTRDKETENKNLETVYKVKKQTMDLLPEAEDNIVKLQNLVESSSARLVTLANQWEDHRAPLINQYRKLKLLNANKLTETQQKLEEIKMLRERMKDLVDETRSKDELHKQLVNEYERMTKDINRSAYTRRILEIVNNIKKQKHEIDKVLVDTKALQKDINQLSGKLDRTFTVTDEIIFRDAKKNDSVRRAYKHLAALHESCDVLIKTVEETGSIMREIRELEDQIEGETQKNQDANLKRISSDYKQMKQENIILISKLKK